MINLEALDILDDKIYNQYNDKYVVYEKQETSFPYADFKPLGCLNGFMYLYADGYLIKNTLEQTEIARMYIDEVEAGIFLESFDHMYLYKGNKLYNISENLEINWIVDFDDDIKDVAVDALDNTYIIFENLRLIRKYDNNGSYIGFYNESETFGRLTKLYTIFVTDGGGDLYVAGSDFWDNKATSYIDHYDTRKFTRIERMQIYDEVNDVSTYDPYFSYHDICIDGDYLYIYAENYIEKRNIKMRTLWSHPYGYNQSSKMVDNLCKVTFDDEKFKQRIFFCENLESSNGYSIGKLSPNGNLLWEILVPDDNGKSDFYPDSQYKREFNIMVYNSEIYTCSKRAIGSSLEYNQNYLLSLDNYNVAFEVRDGVVVRIMDNNYDSIYAPENYVGTYLLASRVKDNIPENIDYYLAHDNGPVVAEAVTKQDEEGNALSTEMNFLLLTEENKDYTAAENYNHFKIIGFKEGITPKQSFIQTLNGNRLLTIENSYIETLKPYDPDSVYQQVVMNGVTISSPDADLSQVRDYFYLLADYHRFLSHIITKNKDLTIITKKSGFPIARKVKYVHKYYIKRLVDIDIIVEYLEQKGLLETILPRYVEKLRYHTESNIAKVQEYQVPRLYDMKISKVYHTHYVYYIHKCLCAEIFHLILNEEKIQLSLNRWFH